MIFLAFIVLVLLIIFVNYRLSILASRIDKIEKGYSLNNTVSKISSVGNEKSEQKGENVMNESYKTVDDRINLQNTVKSTNSVNDNESTNRFVNWLKEDWLLKLGAMLLLIGFGWLTTYAFMNNWIGPVGRITLGIIAGAIILTVGTWRIRKYLHQGGVFLVLGSTVIILTVFAGRVVYDFFTPFSALAIMFISTVFIGLSSVKYRSGSLALSGLILAGVAPFLTKVSSADYIWMFAYLLVIVLGFIWIIAVTGKKGLAIASLIMVIVHVLGFEAYSPNYNEQTVLLFIFAFCAIFFLASIIWMTKKDATGVINNDSEFNSNLFFAGANGVFLLISILSLAPENWRSIILIAWLIVFIFGTFLVYKVLGDKKPFITYLGVCVAFIASATATELDGSALTIAFSIEAGIITIISYLVTKNTDLSSKVAYLMIVPIFMSFSSINTYVWQRDGILNENFAVLLILGVILATIGYIFSLGLEESKKELSKMFSFISYIFASFYFFALVWLISAVEFPYNTAVLISLIIYTIVGIFSYFTGLKNGKLGIKRYGSIVVALVIIRLLFVDIWNMAISWRIITFFIIGVLLVSTAFYKKSKKNVITTLSLILLLSTALFNSVALAKTVSFDEIKTAFKYQVSLNKFAINVPKVIDISLTGDQVKNKNHAVFNNTLNRFEPSVFISNTFIKPKSLKFSIPENSIGNQNSLSDGEPLTYIELPSNGSINSSSITVSSSEDITSSYINFLFDKNTIIPEYIEITAIVDNVERVVLARKLMNGNIVNFPKTTSKYWLIKLEHTQPVRISEFRFGDDDSQKINENVLRFLAKPNETYTLYLNADRFVDLLVSESGNLIYVKDTLKYTLPNLKTNPVYKPADVDGDGVIDINDNCPNVSNSNQEDVDDNGIGDLCEDFDQDGILNINDNCPNDPNANQIDTDGDKKGDVCDAEESRLTERLPWLPWVGIGLAGLLIGVMSVMVVRNK